MRCSLLTLSTYLDGELAPDRAGEVEAHLVACQRCSSGLGYLREEQAHIHALAAVNAAPGAAEDLLGTVGLAFLPAPVVPEPARPAPQFLLDLATPPKPAPVGPPPGENGSYLELNGSPTPKGEPEKASSTSTPENGVERFGPETFETNSVQPRLSDSFTTAPADAIAEPAGAPSIDPPEATRPALPHEPPQVERAEQSQRPASPAPPGPPRWSQPYARIERAPEVRQPSLDPPARQLPAAEAAVPPRPAAPNPAVPAVPQSPAGRPSSWLDRARDAVALRWALMRGSSANDIDDDDTIQIVSGTGAPARRTRHPSRPVQETQPPSATGARPAVAPAPLAASPVAKPDISFAPPEHEPLQRPAFTARERLAARAAAEKLAADGVLANENHVRKEPEPAPETRSRSFTFDMQDPVAPPVEVPRPRPQPDEPAGPGRHQRALNREGTRFGFPSFSPPRPKKPSPSRPAPLRPSNVASPLNDRRLWIFGSVVLTLGLIGLLIGKSSTPAPHHLAPGAVPNPTAIALPSAHASSAPTPLATPQPTPQPTATPAPTPAAPNPSQLTGAQNLGAGGTGFTVQDIRYGAHPGDFRIVFDLNGTGSPTTTVGFGAPTTLYVEFTGTTGTASVAQPASGNTATAVKLLQPSPIAGKTIYEITLSGAAKLSTMYLESPLRLVIDLS